MKFRKMNQNTIKCVLSEQELKDNGLDVYELFQNEDKTRVFMQGVFAAAQREMGENSESRFASMEVTLLPNRDVELTLSKSSEEEILKSLEYLKTLANGSIEGITMERIEQIARLRGAEQRAAYKELLNCVSSSMNSDAGYEKEEALEGEENGKNERYNRYYTFELGSMEDVFRLVGVIEGNSVLHAGLYRMDSDKYYILIDAKGVSFSSVYKFLGTSLEFVQDIVPGGNRQAYIREHSVCMISDYTFQVLRKMC